MAEIVTDALVIDKEPVGEADSRIFLYTEKLGGVSAKVTSARKITSKLSPHLEPLTFATVRLIEKGNGDNGFQLGDALQFARSDGWREQPDKLREALNLVTVFKEKGFQGDPDPNLWQLVKEIFTSPPAFPMGAYATRILGVLGFDPRFARCDSCLRAEPARFSFDDMAFYCATCANRQISGKLVYNL